jgi:hypothetical protein
MNFYREVGLNIKSPYIILHYFKTCLDPGQSRKKITLSFFYQNKVILIFFFNKKTKLT